MGTGPGAEHADDAGAQGETLSLAKVLPSVVVGVALICAWFVSLHARGGGAVVVG